METLAWSKTCESSPLLGSSFDGWMFDAGLDLSLLLFAMMTLALACLALYSLIGLFAGSNSLVLFWLDLSLWTARAFKSPLFGVKPSI